MRALLSVYDKTGLVAFAEGLAGLGFDLISSGGTSQVLADAGIKHTKVDEVTGAPEMLGGRVKTLHPKVHGGILADRNKPEHMADLAREDIEPIDLVVCNLYPFTSDPSIELIDVGGPTMVRAAAKNFAHVGIVVDPKKYGEVLDEIRVKGSLTDETRQALARDAFAHTAAYDAAIVDWFSATGDDEGALPQYLHLDLEKVQSLRYGENPHQQGARYRKAGSSSWWDRMFQHGGKELSYLNLYDTEAAWKLVHELDRPTAAVIKHANPCGVATADDITTAYKRARDCDPTSAFGGIVAVNRPVPIELAKELTELFTEVVIAPSFNEGALEVLLAKKNLRVLEAPAPTPEMLDIRTIEGGLLLQESDTIAMDRANWKVVTKSEPTNDQWRDMELAWVVCSYVKSNAIVLVKDGQAFGIGAGQQSRVDAGEVAAKKANGRATNGVCASDAFFPFRDGLDSAASAGATAVIQPGGSLRDDEVIAAADEQNMAMVFTGERHFRH